MLAEPRTWQLEVAAVQDLTPRMRRVQLTSPDLDHFDYLAGQDMALTFRRGDSPPVRRRYTIRHYDRDQRRLDLEFVLHGDGPGMRWAQAARPGDGIEVVGPRGKITLVRDAAWNLFAGPARLADGVHDPGLRRVRTGSEPRHLPLGVFPLGLPAHDEHALTSTEQVGVLR